jgi:hypothetical protein
MHALIPSRSHNYIKSRLHGISAVVNHSWATGGDLLLLDNEGRGRGADFSSLTGHFIL